MSASCPACACASFDVIGKVGVHEQHLHYTRHDEWRARELDEHIGHGLSAYAMHRCTACHLEYAHPPLAPGAAWYGALYAATDLYPPTRSEYRVVADAVSRDQVLIDYGCGSGHFMFSMRDRAARIVGFDFSAAGIEGALAKGLDARVLDAGHREIPRADHVTAFHVLEHLPQPRDLFAFAHAAARDGTRLWVAVPSDRRASRVYDETDAFDLPPHHLTRWTPRALRHLGASCGWVLSQLWYEPLPPRLRVWEATRRLALYEKVSPSWRPLQWLWRRSLATAVWLAAGHRMRDASGFSMLACFTRTEHR